MRLLTGFSEALFLLLAAHPILAVLTIAVAVAIWVLPNRLLKDTNS
jgi:hypothetical protein